MNNIVRIWKRKPFALCGWLLLFFGMSVAQTKINSITIQGNSYFSQRQLLEQIPPVTGQPLSSLTQFTNRLQELYRAEGFYTFTVDSIQTTIREDSLTAVVVLYVTEGEQTVISQIIFSGNRTYPNSILTGLMETSLDSPLQPHVLESDIRAILEFYSRSGFPFTTISSDSIKTEDNDHTRLIVHLVISEGPVVLVQEITVAGNSVTSSNTVIREAGIFPGTLFNQDRIDEFRRRLERLQLFSSVAEPQLTILSGSTGDTLRGGLLVTVTEGSTNTFDGIIGYVPAVAPSTEGYVTGNVFIALRNLFGTGRKAMITWQRETALTQELELQYKEPWLFGIPFSLGAKFRQRKQDSTFVRTNIELRGEYSISSELMIAGNISSESVTPSSSLQQFTLFESNGLFLGAEVLYDTRDNLRNPTGGVRYSTTVQQGTKNITGPEQFLSLAGEKSFSIQKYSVDAEFYIATFLRQVVLIGIHGKQITSSRLELSDLFPLGGTTTVRGYRENQFFASQIAYINAEYRFLTGRASSFFGFVDGGYFSRPADPLRGTLRLERSLYGYGVGARIETGLGIMNINYALGEGDSFSNGKIHVGIINEF